MEKAIIEDNKDQFVGADILKEANLKLVHANREEALDKAAKLITKEYATRNQIKDLEAQLKKANESLTKTLEKRKKVEAGDLSVLFTDND